jgi:hypothetical protein
MQDGFLSQIIDRAVANVRAIRGAPGRRIPIRRKIDYFLEDHHWAIGVLLIILLLFCLGFLGSLGTGRGAVGKGHSVIFRGVTDDVDNWGARRRAAPHWLSDCAVRGSEGGLEDCRRDDARTLECRKDAPPSALRGARDPLAGPN